ncbi:threonine and homoserine efflux system [mine drainage metagenome]|uniref:Threonine and homoserine efflux system n=1 Tax=mine drainage metagenome TaxID=410659 RepID=A0A1J5PH49_9ZZZZ
MRARLLVIFSGICFGTTGTAQALGPKDASSLTIGATRLLVGSLLLILVAGLSPKSEREPTKVRRRAWVIAGLGMSCYQLTFFAAVRSTGVAVGTVVALGSAPAITGLLSWLVLRHRPSRIWFAATVVAVVGVTTIATSGASAHVNAIGVLLALGAGLSYALFAISSKEILQSGISTEQAMARIFAIGAVPLLPILYFGNTHWLFTSKGIALALWLGLVPTAIAYLAYGAGLRHLHANEASTLTLAEPITATLLGFFLLHQHLGAPAWSGIILVFSGLVLLSLQRTRQV